MRKTLCAFVALLLIVLSACAGTSGAASVDPTLAPDAVITFSDVAFGAKLRGQLGLSESSEVLYRDCLAVTELNFCNPAEGAAEEDMIRSLEDLRYFPNVVKLDIGGNAVEDLSPLSHCPKLAYIEAPKNRIKDLSPIAGLTELYWAVFWGNEITDISAVAGLTKLETFSVFSNRVTDISALAGLTNLKILELHDNLITDFSPAEAIYPQLTEKDFSLQDVQQPQETASLQPQEDYIQFTDEVLERKVREAMNAPEGEITCEMAEGVTELLLGNEYADTYPEGTQINHIGALKYFVNLTRLELQCNTVQDVTPLSGLTKLTYLDLNGNNVEDISPLSGCTGLIVLDLTASHDTDLTPLAGLTKLEHLRLYYTQVTDISPLANLTNLKSLILIGSHVEDYSPLANLTKLTSLMVCLPDEKYNPDYSPLAPIYGNLQFKNFTLG